MEEFHALEELNLDASWAAIGVFDGMHIGHQNIIRRLVYHAHLAKTKAVVLTFHPHPAVVLRGMQGAFMLSDPAERAALLASMGVDVMVTLHFDLAMAALSADDFMLLLKRRLGLRRLYVGYDFALGRGRAGDIPTLTRLGEQMGYEVEMVSPVLLDDEIVSSSRIRGLLATGDVNAAARLLGRRYSLQGTIVHGDGRGRRLGIPTANLEISPDRILPALGVYATLARSGERLIPSVTNIGIRPTFESGPTAARVETHLLDFDADLYGSTLELIFVKYLRPEQRFNSLELLIAQIQQDIHHAREALKYA